MNYGLPAMLLLIMAVYAPVYFGACVLWQDVQPAALTC